MRSRYRLQLFSEKEGSVFKRNSKIGVVAGCGLLLVGAFVFTRYKSVPVNCFIAKTGLMVKGIYVSRKTMKWPFQNISVINMDPINYHFLGSNMSAELVPFELPLTFTVSPVHPEVDLAGFERYATRLGAMGTDEVKNILSGIVNGETRVFVASMTIDEIFRDREAFKCQVVNRIQKDLEQFGIQIFNANIEEMKDTHGNCYFENLKKKALENALTRSRVDVAEARKIGDIGEKSHEVDTRKERSVLEANVKEIETIQSQRMSDYEREMSITVTSNKKLQDSAALDAYNVVESRKIEIDAELNKKRQAQELERLRSQELIKATAESEALVKRTEADALAIKLKADADLYAKEREANGKLSILQATAKGLKDIYDVSTINPEMAQFYLALENGIFRPDGLMAKLGTERANAIRGLSPKINIWNTGTSGSKSDPASIIKDITHSIPPIVDFVANSGIQLPEFLKADKPADKSSDHIIIPSTKTKSVLTPDIDEKSVVKIAFPKSD